MVDCDAVLPYDFIATCVLVGSNCLNRHFTQVMTFKIHAHNANVIEEVMLFTKCCDITPQPFIVCFVDHCHYTHPSLLHKMYALLSLLCHISYLMCVHISTENVMVKN